MCDYCHDNITMNRLLAVCEDSPAEIPYYVRMVADNMWHIGAIGVRFPYTGHIY